MNETKSSLLHRSGWIYILLMIMFSAIVYREALIPGNVLFTTDDSLGAMAMRKSLFPHAFWSGWYDVTAAGVPMFTPVTITNLLLMVLSPVAFMNIIHAFDLAVGSIFLMLFLRLRGLGWMAATLGALVTYWFGSTFFLTYAGHIGKFGAVMFAGIYLYTVERAVRDRSWSFAVLAGAAMAGMFLEQQDSALFFSTVLGPYALFRGWQAYGFRIGAHARTVAPLLVTAGIIALHSVYSAMSFYRMDVPSDGDEQSWQELWDYCTQWSWPPSETIEFIAPGYMGWRTGEPTGPYWGALGRMPQWQPQFGPNGKNFKLETFYQGFLPMMFLVLGLYVSLVRRRDDREARQQMIFWSVAGLVTFLLACGKYTPLYRIFFELPGVSSIRNPVKFMQITQFAMGIIAATGLDWWLNHVRRAATKDDGDTAVAASFRRGLLIVAGLLTLFVVILAVQQGSARAAFQSDGWGQAASAIVKTRLIATVHLAVMAWIGYGLLTAGSLRGKVNFTSWRHLGAALLAVVFVDQLLVSGRYVAAVKTDSLVSRGDLIPYLEQELGHQRLLLYSPPGNAPGNQWGNLYNQWQTILLPNYQIPTVNMISMRMPDDYEAFYTAMRNEPFRMWSHMAMGLALTPSEFWNEMTRDPAIRNLFEPVAGFNLVQAGESGVTTLRASGQQPAQHVLLRPRPATDRFALITAWEGAELNDAVTRLQKTEPLTRVVVSPSVPGDWPASGPSGRTGTVEVESYRAGRIELLVKTDQPTVLRVADKITPDWRAFVDGEEVPVHRVDGIFMGVFLQPSDSTRSVRLEFMPQRATLYLQLAGFGLTGIALVGACFTRRRNGDQKE